MMPGTHRYQKMIRVAGHRRPCQSSGNQVADLTHSLFGDNLWVWGAWDLCLAVLALLAGVSLLNGGGLGRLLGYIWAIWVIVQSFLIIA